MKHLAIRAKASVSLLSLLAVACPVFAQETGKAPADDEVSVELIRRPLMRTGNSAVVVTGESLESQAGLDTVRDVLETVPNLTLVTGTGKAPSVRGVDGTGPAENANAFFAGSRARLSWRIDGRPASYNEIVFGDIGLWDVARVEVLRGPQSTLVGRNAIAGTVVIETRDPEFTRNGAAQLAAGDLEQKRASLMYNLPLAGDTVALRLSGDWYERQSATQYQSYAGVEDPGDVRSVALRGKLLFVSPSDADRRLLITAAHTSHKGPNGEIIVRPFGARNSNFPMQPVHEPSTTSLSAEGTYPLGGGLSLEAFASVTDFSFRRRAVPNSSNARIDTDEKIFETRLRYQGAAGVSWVSGLYVYQADQKEFIEFIAAQNFDDTTDTFAAYAEGVLPLGERLDLSVGARYEHEKRHRKGGDAAGAIARISSDATYDAFLPKIGLTWKTGAASAWGVQVSRGYNAGGGGIAFAIPIVNYEYSPEYVWTTELFGRQSWAEGRVRTTQNLFVSHYRDMQLPFDLTPNNSHDEAFVVRNAPEVRTTGAEFAIAATLSANLKIHGGLGLLDTRITRYPGSGVEGNELLTAPSVTANAGAEWTSGRFSAAGSLVYTGGYFTDINNRERGRTDDRVIADLQLGYDFGRVQLFGSVKNLFDSEAAVARYPGLVPAGGTGSDSDYDSAVLVQPRSVLIGLRTAF